MSEEIRRDRFTSFAGELEVILPVVLKEELESNLQKMQNEDVNKSELAKLTKRNVEIQKLLISNNN